MKLTTGRAIAVVAALSVLIVVSVRFERNGSRPAPAALGPRKLAILKQPAPRHRSGKAISFQLAVQDEHGDVVTGSPQPLITIGLGTNPTGQPLGGITQAVAGPEGILDLRVGATTFSFRQDLTDENVRVAALAVGDLNGDDLPDLVLLDATNNRLTVALGAGDGKFRVSPSDPVGSGLGGTPTDVKLADVDGDGILDAVVSFQSERGSWVQVFKGFEDPNRPAKGLGRFVAEAPLLVKDVGPAPTNAVSIVLADLNLDGVFDLVVCDNANSALVWFTNDGTGKFTQRGSVAVGASPVQVVAKDLDGDEGIDLVCADSLGVTVARGAVAPLGSFAETFRLATGGPVSSVVLTDYDGDGKTDVLAVVPGAGRLHVFRNTSEKGHLDASTLAEVAAPALPRGSLVAAGDLNNDGHVDLVLVDPSSGEAHALYGDGAGAFAELGGPCLGAPAGGVVIADLTGDNSPDVASIGTAGVPCRFWENNGPASSGGGAPSLSVAGVGYTLVATAPGCESATTTPFTVEADPGTDPLVVTLPAELATGEPFSVTVALTDGSGNVIPSRGDRIHLSCDGRDAGSRRTVEGVAVFRGLRAGSGRVRIVATDPAKELVTTSVRDVLPARR